MAAGPCGGTAVGPKRETALEEPSSVGGASGGGSSVGACGGPGGGGVDPAGGGTDAGDGGACAGVNVGVDELVAAELEEQEREQTAVKMAEAGAALPDRKAGSPAKLAERRSDFEVQVPEVASPVGVGGGRASRVEVLHAAAGSAAHRLDTVPGVRQQRLQRLGAGSAARRLNMSGVDDEDGVSDVGAAERKADVVRLWPTLQRVPGANVGGKTSVVGHSVPGRLVGGLWECDMMSGTKPAPERCPQYVWFEIRGHHEGVQWDDYSVAASDEE